MRRLVQLKQAANFVKAVRAAQIGVLSPWADLKTRFLNGIIKGHIALIKKCLDEGVDPNSHFGDNVTPLQYAVEMHNLEMVTLLVQQKNIKLNMYTMQGNTPLNYACRYGYTTIAKVLLEYGADVEIRDNFGNAPLHSATIRGNEEIVYELLKHGAKPNITNCYGITPLYIAINELPNPNIVLLLLEFNADVNFYDPRFTMSLLMEACLFCTTHEQLQLVELLLKHGADVNEIIPGTLRTALHIAAFTGNVELIKILLKYNPQISSDVTGQVPVAVAAFFRNYRSVKALQHQQEGEESVKTDESAGWTIPEFGESSKIPCEGGTCL